MGQSKELLLRNKDLSSWWNAIATKDEFASIIIHAQSEFAENVTSSEAMLGVMHFCNILKHLAESENTIPLKMPTAGLNQDIDNPRAECEASLKATKTGTTPPPAN
jgi:hypothetical protein